MRIQNIAVEDWYWNMFHLLERSAWGLCRLEGHWPILCHRGIHSKNKLRH